MSPASHSASAVTLPTAWLVVARQMQPLLASLVLAVATSVSALAVLTAWFEWVPQKCDKGLMLLCLATLGMPGLLLGLGQYRLMLQLGLVATPLGLYLAHLAPVAAYMFLLLMGPTRAFDPRWREASAGLGVSLPRFFIAVKWPLLKPALLSSLAVGFAVSFAQYVPAQLISAGRYSTLPMEAVTLSSGGNRPLAAAFALLLMVPPLVAFALGGRLSRSRWSAA